MPQKNEPDPEPITKEGDGRSSGVAADKEILDIYQSGRYA
jgi:hypothetical protein